MDFWSMVAFVYDISESVNGRVYRETVLITERMVPAGARVLDCAAGTGELSLAAAKRAKSVLCTDNSARMLAIAEKKSKRRGFSNISFERRNIFHLDDADGTYDVVIAGNVLHLLAEPEKAVRELWRVTKSGGRILLPTFTLKNISAFSKAMLKIYGKLGFDPRADYSPKSYVKMLRSADCGRVRAKVIRGFIPCCYAVIIKK